MVIKTFFDCHKIGEIEIFQSLATELWKGTCNMVLENSQLMLLWAPRHDKKFNQQQLKIVIVGNWKKFQSSYYWWLKKIGHLMYGNWKWVLVAIQKGLSLDGEQNIFWLPQDCGLKTNGNKKLFRSPQDWWPKIDGDQKWIGLLIPWWPDLFLMTIQHGVAWM